MRPIIKHCRNQPKWYSDPVNRRAILIRLLLLAALAAMCPILSHAEEHITLANGFELDCVRREMLADTGKIRLYTSEAATYLDVAATSISLIEPIVSTPPTVPSSVKPPAPTDIHSLLAASAARHHIDADLLASLIKAESGGHPQAVSRAGARGLMQLMPSTASSLGVQDSFSPGQNIAGGTTYLDQLLTRFHDDITLALAAYNAGPAAVDRYHGIPPYRETHAYVARILNEYNRRKNLALAAAR